MSKIAFLASFLASYMTMDSYFFDGSTTRFVWRVFSEVANATQAARIVHRTHPNGRR